MPTFAKQLLDALEVAVTNQMAVPSSSIFIERTAAIDEAECPALNLAVGGARKLSVIGAEGGYDLIELEVDLTVSIHTRGDPRTRVADPIAAAVNGAVMADWSLGDLATRLGLFEVTPRNAGAGAGVGIADFLYRARCVVNERTLSILTP